MSTDSILKCKSKSFRELLKIFYKINRLDYILTLKIVNYCFESKYFSKEDITDLSNLFEAYLHFLLYKKKSQIFLLIIIHFYMMLLFFLDLDEESKRNNGQNYID
jgi:hypothetical protein